jgi:hypothetical protein
VLPSCAQVQLNKSADDDGNIMSID